MRSKRSAVHWLDVGFPLVAASAMGRDPPVKVRVEGVRRGGSAGATRSPALRWPSLGADEIVAEARRECPPSAFTSMQVPQ
jgi:hypothetical protein